MLDFVACKQEETKTMLFGKWLTHYTSPKRQILGSSKLKEFADDNFKFYEKGKKFSKQIENTVRKGEIAR